MAIIKASLRISWAFYGLFLCHFHSAYHHHHHRGYRVFYHTCHHTTWGDGALRQPAFHRIVSPRCGRSDRLRRNMECFIPPPSFILPLLYPEFSINAQIPTRWMGLGSFSSSWTSCGRAFVGGEERRKLALKENFNFCHRDVLSNGLPESAERIQGLHSRS